MPRLLPSLVLVSCSLFLVPCAVAAFAADPYRGLLITEVIIAPVEQEGVEICNTNASGAIDLSGVILTDRQDRSNIEGQVQFPEGTLLPAGEFAYVYDELLTWLLWRSEERSGLIGVGETEVHFGEAVTLAAPFGDAEEVTLRGENPAASPELMAALREGKLVSRAALRWVVGGVEWHVAVRGQTLDFGGLKPPLKSAPPDAEWIARRLELFEEFQRAFDAVVDAFLALRLSETAWKREVESMRAWVARATKAGAPAPHSARPEVIEIRDDESR